MKTLPTQDVRAIGQKFGGWLGFTKEGCLVLRWGWISSPFTGSCAQMEDARLSNQREMSPWTVSCLQSSTYLLSSAVETLSFTLLTIWICEAPGSSFITSITSWCGLKAALVDISSAAVFLLAIRRTVESWEHTWEAARPHLVFLNMLLMDGRWRPPLLLGRYSQWVAVFQARPDHCSRNSLSLSHSPFLSLIHTHNHTHTTSNFALFY